MLSSIWLRIKNHWVFNWYIELNQIKLQVLACFTAKLWELGRKWGDWWWEVKSVHVAIACCCYYSKETTTTANNKDANLLVPDWQSWFFLSKEKLPNQFFDPFVAYFSLCLLMLSTNYVISMIEENHTTKLFAISWLKMENWKMSSHSWWIEFQLQYKIN